ncbi:MAG TPA: aminotransferase class IV [Draconibacterium sp.]|nr:aminotransferase class IV [Draconibacterium sp.]
MKFVIVNGVVCNKEEAIISDFLWNQPLTVSQNIWFGYGGIPLLKENLLDLREQMASLGKTLPPVFAHQRELFRLCKRMLNKNKFYRSGHLHFRFFISGKEPKWLVEAVNYEEFEFPFPDSGLLAEISSLTKLSTSELNRFSSHNQLLWTAARVKTGTPATRPIILNEKGMVCEASDATIFLIKKGVLVTPSLESGCYQDVIRQIIIDQAIKNKIQVIESVEIDAKMLLAADEIFLASEARGIEWILGIENKRFVRNYSLLLHEKVDEYLKEKAKL